MALVLSLINIFFLCTGLFTLVDRSAGGIDASLKWVISLTTGFALISYFYYASLALHCPYYLLLLIISGLNAMHLKRSLPLIKSGFAGAAFFLRSLLASRAFFFLSIALLLMTLYFIKYLSRWGGWDAWAIWNMHAKYLYYPDGWTNMFSGKIAFSHPDYPLMLPSVIAFLWRAWGAIAPVVPAAICYLVQIAVPLVIFLTLYKQQGAKLFAFAALLVFVADGKYNALATAQYADTLLALFILLSFVLYRQIGRENSNLVYFLGFSAAAATWVKNEGVLFYAAFSVTFFLFNGRRPALLVKYFLGSLIPLLALVSFKLLFAPPGDLIYGGRMEDIKHKLQQADRYLIILRALSITMIHFFWVVPLLIVMNLIFKPNIFRSFAFMALAIVLTGYFLVYVTTPNDLVWHLESSSDRIMHQVYPAMVYLLLSRLALIYTSRRRVTSLS